MIKLQSCDGEIFNVDVKIAKMSNTIKTMLDDLGMEADSEEAVPLPNVSADILKKIIEWSTHHKDDIVPTEDDSDYQERSSVVPAWDEAFLKVDNPTLFEIILAANYLDIKELLENGCKTVANMMKGKKPEEIRKIFNIVNDLTPEEEEQIRKENEWCEEK